MEAKAIRSCRLVRCLAIGGALWMITAPASAEERKPSFMHGVGQVIGGLVFEFPRTVVEATLDGPPVAGTLVGVLAGVARAVQTTFRGFEEMSASVDPWGIKSASRNTTVSGPVAKWPSDRKTVSGTHTK